MDVAGPLNDFNAMDFRTMDLMLFALKRRKS
jgi:hypothetical protein